MAEDVKELSSNAKKIFDNLKPYFPPDPWNNLAIGFISMLFKYLKIIVAVSFALICLYYSGVTLGYSQEQEQEPSPPWIKKSFLEVVHPVELPGIILVKGVYFLSLEKVVGERHVIRLLNEDQSRTLANFLALPDYRVKEDRDALYTYHFKSEEEPWPIHSWYHQLDVIGLEFVYPKKRAIEIAKVSGESVLASESGINGVIVAITPSGSEAIIDKPLSNR